MAKFVKRRVMAGLSAVLIGFLPSLQYTRGARAAMVTEELLTERPVTPGPTEPMTRPPTSLPTQAPTAPSTEVPTEAPTNPPPTAPTDAPTQAPTGVPTETPTVAPTDPATELPTDIPVVEDGTAANTPGFERGYAFVILNTSIYTKAHARDGSDAVLTLGRGESLRVRGRLPYAAARNEEVNNPPDWFEVVTFDAEGTKVEGYVPGNALRPYTPEERAALEQRWMEDPEGKPENGILTVSGLYEPPPTREPAATPDPGATLDPEATPAPEETQDPDTTPDPSATQDPGATPDPDVTPDPNATPDPDMTQDPGATLDPDATSDPAVTPDPSLPPATESLPPSQGPSDPEESPDPQPTATPAPPLDILAGLEATPQVNVLDSAQALLDLSFGGESMMLAAMAGVNPDTYGPQLQGIQIVTDPIQPGKATILATVVDDVNPADVYALVSGVSRVTLTDSLNRVYPMLPTSQADVYGVVVYDSDTYTLDAVDAEGNAMLSPSTFSVTIAPGAATADVTAPVILDPRQDPTGGQVDVVRLSCLAEDPTPALATEEWSELAGVWVRRTLDERGQPVTSLPEAMAVDPDTGRFIHDVKLNGTYEMMAADWAGNEATHLFTITNIRPADTWAPVLRNVHLSTDEAFQEYVQVLAEVYEEQNPNDAQERISGLVTVAVAPYYGEDPDTGEVYFGDLMPCQRLDDSNWYACTLYQSGEYVYIAIDEAGNRSTQIFLVENVGEPPKRPADPNYVPVHDDDHDGMLSRNEYRLGFNPALLDTNGDGFSDGLSVLLGVNIPSLLQNPEKSFLAKDADFLANLSQKGTLGAPVGDANANEYRARIRGQWEQGRNVIFWWNPLTAEVACVGTNALLRLTMEADERPVLDGALSFYALGMGKTGDYSARTLQCTADGRMALLYDREGHGGPLKADAYLVDMQKMLAYPIPDTAGSLNLVMDDAGGTLAIQHKDRFEVVQLNTGKSFSVTDPEELARIDLIYFLPTGQIVTRVTPLGYSAYQLDGNRAMGDALALPVMTVCQDNTQITVIDLYGKPLTMDFHAQMRSSGIYVTSEEADVAATRHVSPRTMVEMARGGANVTASNGGK